MGTNSIILKVDTDIQHLFVVYLQIVHRNKGTVLLCFLTQKDRPLVSDHLPVFPFTASESQDVKACFNAPVENHRHCDPDHSHTKPFCEQE